MPSARPDVDVAQLRVRNPPWESSGIRIPPGFLRNCASVPRNLGSMTLSLQVSRLRERIRRESLLLDMNNKRMMKKFGDVPVHLLLQASSRDNLQVACGSVFDFVGFVLVERPERGRRTAGHFKARKSENFRTYLGYRSDCVEYCVVVRFKSVIAPDGVRFRMRRSVRKVCMCRWRWGLRKVKAVSARVKPKVQAKGT